MKKFNLYDMDSIEIADTISEMKINLKKNNEEYRKLVKKIENIKDKYPRIRDILDDECSSELTAEEGKALVNIVTIYYEISRIEEYQLFLLGGKEIFGILKKLKIL